jgi:predicted PurR-regulated permease PerM
VLGIVTFLLSLIPMGPPLVWIPATAWLAWKGEYGMAVFLGIWGTFIISGVDNVLKPYLISRGGNLPLVIVLLGVFGGLIAFGFIGLFIGPTLLAVAYSLLTDWSKVRLGFRFGWGGLTWRPLGRPGSGVLGVYPLLRVLRLAVSPLRRVTFANAPK